MSGNDKKQSKKKEKEEKINNKWSADMKKKLILFIILMVVFQSDYLFAHDDKVIHPKITEKAAENPDIYLNSYFKNNLDFKDGLETILPSNGEKLILDWLTDGSTAEDSPMCRASNHFHDPMNKKSWSTSGMSDEPLWADAVCKEMNFTIEMRK